MSGVSPLLSGSSHGLHSYHNPSCRSIESASQSCHPASYKSVSHSHLREPMSYSSHAHTQSSLCALHSSKPHISSEDLATHSLGLPSGNSHSSAAHSSPSPHLSGESARHHSGVPSRSPHSSAAHSSLLSSESATRLGSPFKWLTFISCTQFSFSSPLR